ncbi:methyl-accepting chemotaxis protein [Dehalobacter sp. DCM]|uniref:methyl-accepting chemotaxis protein n=1 Tax=Dehalobacter sp. DCM TaxID=2907827 RepID=UPI0030820004|nr:methyl-accepting chemotaxis protein [Dehalobacter sp. DCM]
MTLRKQIQIILLVFTLIPVLAGSLISYYLVSKDLAKIEQEQVLFSQQANERTVDFLADRIRQGVNSYGFWEDAYNAVQSKDLAWINEQLVSVAAEDYSLNFVAVCDKSGKVIDSIGTEKFSPNVLNDPLLQRVAHGQEKIVNGLYQASGKLALVAVCQILNNNGEGSPSGYLIFGQYLTEAHLKTVTQLTGAEVMIYLLDGKPSLTTNKDLTGMIKDINAPPIELNYKNANYLTSFTVLKDINGQPVAKQGTIIAAQASAKAKQNMVVTNIVIILVCLVVAIGGGYIVSRQMVKPLGTVSNLLNYIGEGDFQHKYEDKIQGEIGDMVKAYNLMVGNLSELIKVTKESAGQVTGSLETVLQHTDQLSRTSEDIREGIQEVALASESSLDKTRISTRDIENMAVGITEISAASSDVLVLAKEAQKASENGHYAMREIQFQMDVLTEKAQKTGVAVQALGETSQRIRNIINTITDIAERTNLLALNAAIESARAGESGRGFAVVADEIRKLAEGSARSTQEIQQLILEINTNIEETIDLMLGQTQVIHQSAAEVEKAGRVFDTIEQTFNTVKVKVEGISYRTVELVGKGNNVVKEVEAAERNAQLVMDRATVINDAADIQMSTMTETVQHVEELSAMASRLEELADKFRIG